ncbi:MAG: hypothetical protein DRI56_11405 [Chloroflexota bacterium]|nr:MAG: hypothetical protein DRI56_11405 [Chloroflexota bacterium]
MRQSFAGIENFLEQRKKRILLILLLVTLATGIAYSIYLGDELRFLPDEQDYLTLAQNLVGHQKYAFPIEQSPRWTEPTPEGLVPTAYRAPGYPLFLAIFVWAGAGVVHLKMVNFFALALSLFLVYQILEKWTAETNSVAPILGALFVLAYPVLIFTAGTLYPQIFGGLLFLGVLYLLSFKEITYWRMILAGVLWGYLCLTIPLFLYTLPVFLLWMISREDISLKYMGIFICLSLLVIGIWTYRNYRVFDAFVLISTNFGVNLALGNSEFTVVNAATDVNFLEKWPIMHHLTEVEQNTHLKGAAWNFIVNNKAQALKLYTSKFLNFFNFRNELATETQTPSWQNIVMLITYGPLLLLACLRLFIRNSIPLSKFEALLVILYLGGAFVSAAFFTRIRLRLPFDYALILLDALFIGKIIELWKKTPAKVKDEV